MRDVVKYLTPMKNEFDSIACSGVSGITFGSVLAYRLNKPLVVVRKQKESSHASYSVENGFNGMRYLIVDDFVCSGHTIAYIYYRIKHEYPKAKMYNVLTYWPFDKMIESFHWQSKIEQQKIGFPKRYTF